MKTALRGLALLVAATAARPLPGPEPASPAADRKEFRSDDKYTLHYGVEWRLVRAGMARMSWSPAAGSGFEANLHLESAGLVSKLYRVDDDYRAVLTDNLCASKVLFNAEEGKKRRQTTISFDHTSGKIDYVERDLVKNNIALTKQLEAQPCVYEYLGALHKIRGMKLDPGQTITVPVSDGKKFAEVKVEAQEREQVRTPMGTYNTIRYEVNLFNDVIITKKARMYVWVSDDARRLPVQLRVRMQFLIGTITLQLEKEEIQ